MASSPRMRSMHSARGNGRYGQRSIDIFAKLAELREVEFRVQPNVFEDVTIPANIIRTAHKLDQWSPNPQPSKADNRQQRNSSTSFNIVDIALEQQEAIELALQDRRATDTGSSSHANSGWEYGQITAGERSSLPISAGYSQTAGSKTKRMSLSVGQAPGTSLLKGTGVGVHPGQDDLPDPVRGDRAVLFRSLDSYHWKETPAGRSRILSVAVAPDADFLAAYEGSEEQESTEESGQHDGDQASKMRGEEEPRGSLAMRRVSIAAATAYNTVVRGAASIVRKSSLWNQYEKAKERSKHLQREKWLQILFEYAIYALLLSFIYFVLIGRPLWNGAVWWMYWIVNNRFTIAGTWSVTIGMALFYAYTPLLVLFDKEPPMPDPHSVAETANTPGVANTALLIPCYKAANIIGPTLVAARKIFPAENIFVIANGNSPTPLDNTEEVCREHGVNHVWSPIGSKIVAQYVGCYAAKEFSEVLLIDDDCALPPNFPIVSDQLKGKVMCIGYTIKSVGPDSSKGTLCQQAQDLEYKISGLQRILAGKIGSATFPHGAISLWSRSFLVSTFQTHPGFSVSEDWFFGHAARQLGSRITMCSAIFVETETPGAVLFSSGGARGGFGEMTVFKQRFYRWNFFFVNGIFYNMAYILGSWKLGFWEIGAKLFVFQEVYETLLYLLAPFVLPISLIVRPAFCGYLLAGTLVLYFVSVTIFNEIHLRRRNERVGWVCVYLYYTPYKILLTCINIFSCYYSLYKYAKYFAKRHPKIIEDEKAIEVVLRLEEDPKRNTAAGAPGRRLTVTAVGSHLESDLRTASVLSERAAAGVSLMVPAAAQTRPALSVVSE